MICQRRAASAGRARQARNVVGRPRIYQAANGVWLTDRVQPGYLSGAGPARAGADLTVPVRSVHTDPLPIPDQPRSMLNPHDRRRPIPVDYRTVGH